MGWGSPGQGKVGLGHRKLGLLPRMAQSGKARPACTHTHKHSQACTAHQLFVLFSPLLPTYPPQELSPGIWAQAGYLVPVGH